tara:strand:- start:1300 stop:1785 length:486 start_codon:yes stop_codon:yes gene_type:complete
MFLPIKIKMVFSATVLIVLLGACAQNEPLSATQSNSAASLKTEIFRPVSDVPIPKDAALNAERSLILSDGDEWTGRLVMYSSITAIDAYAFYKTQMPLFDWTPIMSIQSETSVLTFSRTERAATIQIERRALGGSLITVTVARAQDTIQSSPIKPPGQQMR